MDTSKVLSCDEVKTALGTFLILFDGDVLYGLMTALSGELIERRFQFYFSGLPFIPKIKKKKIPEYIYSQFKEYFSGERYSFELKTVLDIQESERYFSEFELKVWRLLKRIPFGETRSYGWVARESGIPSGQRAIGQALKKNPLPVVIPCHRIIGSRGELRGYSLGIELKRRLLMHECYKRSNLK